MYWNGFESVGQRTTSNECVSRIMCSCCVTFDPDGAWWVAQSITERLRKCNHYCMTFKCTQCFALYWALIWIYADAGMNLAACPFFICYTKQHSSSKKTRSSVSQGCLLWYSPTEHIGQHCCLIVYLWFDLKLQTKNVCRLTEGWQDNFQITECDTELMEILYFHIFWCMAGHRVASTEEYPTTESGCSWSIKVWHVAIYCVSVSQESILANSDLMQAKNHFNSSKSKGCYCLWPHCCGPIMKMMKNTITNGILLYW